MNNPGLTLLSSPDWQDYALLDSGDGFKLERYGSYTFVRPEPQAIWQPRLPKRQWDVAHAHFNPSNDENGGRWAFDKPVEPRWKMEYKDLRFWAAASGSRHMGVFPEQAVHWDWIGDCIVAARRPLQVLNLFGYTGLATLAAARAGAKVTHVDASKKAITWARDNQALSGISDQSIRWIVDDALKFVEREARRGSRYDGLILDPPKFGRGPKGEVWEFYKLIPTLLASCAKVLAAQPVFIVLTAYAIRTSALSLYFSLDSLIKGKGDLSCGELVTREENGERMISHAIYARWSVSR